LWGLWPRRDAWTFSLSAASIIELANKDTDEVYRYLATWQARYFDENAVALQNIFDAIRWASVVLVGELGLFLLVIAGARLP
jgi:hypothetical protein